MSTTDDRAFGRHCPNRSAAIGHSVLLVTAAELLMDRGSQDSARGLDRRLRHYAQPALLVCDELGYLSYDNRNADLLFQVVSRRYRNKSILLTTNLPFSDWPSIFPNATCAIALIDRIIHHADIIPIEGDSFRRREAQGTKDARRQKRPNRDTRTPWPNPSYAPPRRAAWWTFPLCL